MAEDESERVYTVVVGLGSGSAPGLPAALHWAADQAASRGGRVVVVRSWRTPAPQATPSGTTAERVPQVEDVERRARQRLEADVRSALGDEHTAEVRLVRGPRRAVLLKAAAGADLVVLAGPAAGSRGLFASRLIGSAPCPVVVVPAPADGT